MSNRHRKYDLRVAARSFLFFLALAIALPLAAAAQPASRCSLTQQYPVGAVFTLDNSPHLWLFAGADGIRWVGDTRALASAGIPVRWDVSCGMDVSFIAQVKKGDPILSAGLVKIGDPIYLAKWEQTDAAPTLLHIQSIGDVEAFGINGGNYGRFVLARADWEGRYSFNADTLPKGELASVAVLAAAAPNATPAPPRPTPGRQYPLQDPPPDDTSFFCLRENPSCTRDPWWVEWNELQRSDMVAYRPTPGFVFESRFVEAIGLLWQWGEGRGLIQDAGSNGVFVVAVPEDALPTAFAGYVAALKGVGFSRRFTQASTWMVADVLAHELKHASDDLQGQFRGNSVDACITREQRAYEVENRFVRWVAGRMGGLPSTRDVATRLSRDDYQLFINIRVIADSPSPSALATQDYRGHCEMRAADRAALEAAVGSVNIGEGAEPLGSAPSLSWTIRPSS